MGALIQQAYSEFPLVMHHPHHRPATMKLVPRTKAGTDQPGVVMHDSISTPEYLPDVTVRDRDEELQYAAKGFMRAGVSDPAAYAAALSGAPPPDHDFHAYPKWKYHAEKEARIVASAKEESDLGPGWADRPDLVAPAAAPAVPSASDPSAGADRPPSAAADAAPKRAKRSVKGRAKRKKHGSMSPEARERASARMKAFNAARYQKAPE
jgi:hypothetical protein